MRLYELSSGASKCKKHRQFKHGNKELPDFAKISGLVSKSCKALLMGDLEKDVKERIHNAFAEIWYPTEETRRTQEEKAWKEIERYVRGENMMAHKRHFLAPMEIDIGLSELAYVDPDFVCVDNGFESPQEGYIDAQITVVKLHTGKARGARDANKSLAKYAMLKYGRTLVSPGKKVMIVAADVFLTRADDASPESEKPHFEMNFWAPNGNNIVSLSEYYVGGTEKNNTDVMFHDVIAQFEEGKEAEECSKSDCEACELVDLCKYNEPPIKKTVEAVKRSAKDLMLTPEQDEAIEYEEGVVRINAGAGVGKTVVVALRTVTLLNKGVKPENILLITFTNAAAEEMRERIKLYNEEIGTGEDISAMKICTFNSFGNDIIKEEYAQFGFNEPPTVVDDVERASIISDLLKKKIIRGLNYAQFASNTKYVKGAVSMATRVFDIMKKGAYSSLDEEKIYSDLGCDVRFLKNTTALQELVDLYDQYDALMRNNNFIEFADQEMMLFELLCQDPYYLEKFGYEHIIVDEYQDTNLKQMELLKKLRACPSCKSLMVVGDDAQAIFSFRNTSPEYIINFKKYIGEDADDIFLLQNHRCTPEIIDFANKINKMNHFRVAKDLIATRPNGKPVTVRGFHSSDDEEQFIIDDIKKHIDSGTKPEDIAIICATKSELRRYASMLTKANIESVCLNPEPFLENSRVKAAIAFVRSLNNEDFIDLRTYVNAKLGGKIFEKTNEEIEELIDEAKKESCFVMASAEAERKDVLMSFLTALDHNDDEVYQKFIEKLEAKPFEKLKEYCEDFLIFGTRNEIRREHSYPGVVLTTCHSSKGLEWPICYASVSSFCGDMEKSANASIAEQEELRRLLFVTATRARDELIITGRYVAKKDRKKNTYNKYLLDSFKAKGTPLNIAEVEAEAAQIQKEKNKQRAEMKKKAAERLKELQSLI